MKEALNGEEKEQFRAAMMREVEMFNEFQVFIRHDIRDVSPDATILDLLVLFSRKYDEKGNIKKHKCRIALRGDQQTEADYDEISSPVIGAIARKIINALSVQYGLKIMQMDFVCAYLHAKMDKVIYVRIPPGLGIEGCDDRNNIYLVDKALYGAKQSGLLFNKLVEEFMKKQGFKQSLFDRCLFFKITNTNNLFIVGIYVDDGEIAYYPLDEQSEYHPFMEAIRQQFKVGEVGDAKWLLGTKIEYDREDGLLELTQTAFIDKILGKLKLDKCSPADTPSVKKSSDEPPSTTPPLPIPFREAQGLFNYLMTTTRPDIAFAVNHLARNMNNPQPDHHRAAKRLGRYLAGTRGLGLMYRRVNEDEFTIKIFVDAAFDTNEESLSQTGYMVVLGGCMIYARSGKQTVVAQSSAEAEYMAAAEASNAAIGIQETVNEIFEQTKTMNIIKTIEMYSDNSAAIEIASGYCNSTVKHIRRRYHVLRQRVINGELIIKHLHTDYQPADALTKSLEKYKFTKFRNQILGYSIAGEK